MKCSACGNNQFYKLTENPFITKMSGEVTVSLPQITPDAFMCEKCGHVEFFVQDYLSHIEKYEIAVKALLVKNKELQELKLTIEGLRSESMSFDEEISKLKNFMSDDNNTVKAIKEAEVKLSLLEKNKRDFMHKTNSASVRLKIESLNKELNRLQITLKNNPLSK